MDRYQQTANAAKMALIFNIFLAIIKLGIGFFSMSSAMISDGLNSAGDVFSTLITFLGNHISKKPNDEDHPNGHGKAEYIFSALIGISLLFVAYNALTNSIDSLKNGQTISYIIWLIVVSFITIATKTFLFIYTNKMGKTNRNPLVLALAQDHKSDVFVTTGTLIGIVGTYFGIKWLDGVVGIIISLVIAKAGFDILRDAYKVLMDTVQDHSSPIVERVKEIVGQCPEVDHIDSIHVRPVGTCFVVELKITVPGKMSVLESHQITKEIKTKVLENTDISNVIVHVNPLETHIGPSIL